MILSILYPTTVSIFGRNSLFHDIVGNLQNVAFVIPGGRKVLIVENDGSSPQSFNIQFRGKWITTSLDAGAVGTYIWE